MHDEGRELYKGKLEFAAEIPDGWELQLRHYQPILVQEHDICSRPLGGTYGMVLAVVAQSGGEYEVVGSAAMVAPGLIITARHVLDEVLSKGGVTGALAVGVTGAGVVVTWHMLEMKAHDQLDIVLASVRPMARLDQVADLWVGRLRPRVPVVGELLLAVGFRSLTTSRMPKEQHLGFFTAAGRVAAAYPNGRDRVLLPGPCVELDVYSLAGMSGGPVFDQAGDVIGVISTSSGDDVGGQPTFVSLADAMSEWDITLQWPAKLYPGRATLSDLLRTAPFLGQDGLPPSSPIVPPGDL